MNPSEAIAALDKSLSIELELCTAWNPPDKLRDNYLRERLDDLKHCIVDPHPINISPSVSARAFGQWEDRPYKMYVVAQSDFDHVLFLNTESGLFSLGAIREDGVGTILGFSSEEALVAWID